MIQRQDFESFVDYARSRLADAGSLAEVVEEWETKRQSEIDREAIQQGIADMEAGRVVPLDEAMTDIRNKLGLTP